MRIAIVDDDPHQLSELEGYVQKYFAERRELCQVVCFRSGVDFVSDYRTAFDIILLDIDMPGLDGISAAKKIRQVDQNAVILFITRMAQYAIRGYEVQAFDFIVKPVDYFHFSVKLTRAIRQIPREESISISTEGQNIFLSSKDILYVEGDNQYVIYHTVTGEYRVHSTLKETEKLLGKGFSRCSNSFIVNIRYLRRIDGNNAIVGEATLPISRGHKKSFVDDVNRYLGGL